MVDRRRIVRQWREGNASALVTLVHVEGSSYRRPGAHLLVGANGEYSGTISGGCLEAEVVRKAAWKVRDGAAVERYSTMFDDPAEIPYGLGCGGTIHLLFEPTHTPECYALLEAMEASLGGAELRVTTQLPSSGDGLKRVVVRTDGEVAFVSEGFASDDIRPSSVTNFTAAHEFMDDRLFREMLSAPQRLFVLGAADDAKPVVTMAALLGWSVTVVDGRSQLTRPERFPEAERVLPISSVESLTLKANDAVVLMTHSYEQDSLLLTELIKFRVGIEHSRAAAPGYIGLLGARHRSSLLISEVAASIGCSVAECCERVYAPVGLDLGGDGPETIALAVVAEVQAWTQGKLGHSRRLTAEDVAEHIAQGGSSQYLQKQCEPRTTELSGR